MTPDLEYWQEDAETITIQPKNFKAQLILIDQFPIHKKTKAFASYVYFGTIRWIFPHDSVELHSFLAETELSVRNLSQELSYSAK